MMDDDGYTVLFNGKDLDGWISKPRVYGPATPGGPTLIEVLDANPAADVDREALLSAGDHPASWTVEDGSIVGRQATPGFGGFLVTERQYADFELVLETDPDWPTDTGVIVRKRLDEFAGLQVLVDHRKSGNVGGFYGNMGGFHAVAWALDAELDDEGRLVRLVSEDPRTTLEDIAGKDRHLTHSADVATFLEAWNAGGWNELRIRVVGEKPIITTWVNGVRIAEIDLGSIEYPGYDADEVADYLGRRGHIALEVHDSAPVMGDQNRWGVGAACRWRNIRIKELS